MNNHPVQFVEQQLKIGDLSVTVTSPKGKPGYKTVKKITLEDGTLIFGYKSDAYNGRKASVRLYDRKGVKYAITVVGNSLIEVYPITQMTLWRPIGSVEVPIFEGRNQSFEDRAYLKHLISEAEGFKPHYTAPEVEALTKLKAEWDAMPTPSKKPRKEKKPSAVDPAAEERQRQANVAAYEAQRDAAHAQADAKHARKAERVARLSARPELVGYDSNNGTILRGIPVAGDEWLSLPHGTKCVAVASYNDETKTAGAIIGEHFIVDKSGNAKRMNVRAFKLGAREGATVIAGEPTRYTFVRQQLLEVDGAQREVNLYTRESLEHLLKELGLKGGAIVGVETTDGRIQLYRFSKGMYSAYGEPVGTNIALASAA